jgi:NCS1 family nucleobase:cation symporter-1
VGGSVRRQNVDIDALCDPPGRSRLGGFRWDALVWFVLGAAATWAFQSGVPKALQGPAARALGGIHLSRLAGAPVAGALYFVLSARRGRSWVGSPA